LVFGVELSAVVVFRFRFVGRVSRRGGFEEHRIMPSVPADLRLVPSLTVFHGESSFHRLKNLEKSDRRGNLS